MNVPNASFGTGDRTKLRRTRGDTWELASCRATSVTEKTTPTNVSIAAAIVERTFVAAEALATHHGASLETVSIAWSIRCMTTARRPDTGTKIAGMNQNVLRRRSLRRTRWNTSLAGGL